jgi:hypothetical protein
MALFAAFTGLPWPECSALIMVFGAYFDKNEPELGVTKCEHCKAEVQVSRDPVTGETWAESVKKN